MKWHTRNHMWHVKGLMCDVWNDPYVIREIFRRYAKGLTRNHDHGKGRHSLSWPIHHSVTWLIQMCDVTQSDVWRASFTCVMCFIHMIDVLHSDVWRDSSRCITWLIRMCDMTYSYVWRDSFICVTRLIHTCNKTHSYVWHDSFIYAWHDHRKTHHSLSWSIYYSAAWLIQTCDMIHSYLWQNALLRVTWLIDTGHDSLMCDVTFSRTLISAQWSQRKTKVVLCVWAEVVLLLCTEVVLLLCTKVVLLL